MIPIFDGIVSDQAVVVVVVLFVVAIIVRCFRQVLEVICREVPGARCLESLNHDFFPKLTLLFVNVLTERFSD